MYNAGDEIIAIMDAYPINYANVDRESYKIPKGTKTFIIDVGTIYQNTQLIKIATGGTFKLALNHRGKLPTYYASCFSLVNEKTLDTDIPFWYTIG